MFKDDTDVVVIKKMQVGKNKKHLYNTNDGFQKYCCYQSVFFHSWYRNLKRNISKYTILVYILKSNILIQDWFPNLLEFRFKIILPQANLLIQKNPVPLNKGPLRFYLAASSFIGFLY
jgi:hypothetical protein